MLNKKTKESLLDYKPVSARVMLARFTGTSFGFKMALKTTSGSGYHFRFVFLMSNLVKNDINIDRV